MKQKIIFLLLIACSATYSQSDGCNANINSRPSRNYTILQNSGNYQLDQFLAREVRVLRQFFQVDPTVVLYKDDADSPNARAMKSIEYEIHPSGTVILGENMIMQEFGISTSGTTIPLVLAHEFGHILDYKWHVTDGEETKITELFADFQAGCFLFYRSVLIGTDVRAVILSFYSKGDYEFNNVDHHGTPQERLNAVLAGYNWLKSVARPGVYISPESSIEAAKEYLGM